MIVAFIMHIKKSLSKLRILYFITTAMLTFKISEPFVVAYNPMYVEFIWIFMLLLIGVIGSTVAGFNGCTVTAAISGIAILIFGVASYSINYYWTLASFFTGSVNLIVAFILHVNKVFPKLRNLYFIPITILIFKFSQFLFELFQWQPMLVFSLLILLLVLGIVTITIMALNNMYSSPLPVKSRKNSKNL